MPTPRVAAHYTLEGHPSTPQAAMFFQRLYGEGRTGGLITARWRQNAAGSKLPTARDQDQNLLHLRGALPELRGLRLSPLPARARSSAAVSSERKALKSRSIP